MPTRNSAQERNGHAVSPSAIEIFLPDGSLDSCVRDDSLPPAGSLLYHPMLERLGMYLPYNHIVNQGGFL